MRTLKLILSAGFTLILFIAILAHSKVMSIAALGIACFNLGVLCGEAIKDSKD